MVRLYTFFDYSVSPPEPLLGISLDGKRIRFHVFFLRGTGLKLKQIYQNIEEYKIFFRSDVIMNDFKTHLAAFGLERHLDYRANDYCCPRTTFRPKNLAQGKKALAMILNELMDQPIDRWQNLYAKAAVIYQMLEDEGVLLCHSRMNPQYSLDTFSGRSKCLGFNMQGIGEDFPVRPVKTEYDTFLHFDWMGADLRMAAFMSNDDILSKSFFDSDPYTFVSLRLKKPRPKAKRALLKAVYSLSSKDDAMQVFPSFRDWTERRVKDMEEKGYLSSLMGRKFYVDGDNKLSVFNAQFQGSVAHAMQAALVQIKELYPAYLFTEIHDCIIMCCPENVAGEVIKGVVKIMLDPLKRWIVPSPRMPLVVSVGKEWRKWEKLRVYR